MDFYSKSNEFYQSIDKNFIKSRGIVYTPQWLAQHITNNAVVQWRKLNSGRSPLNSADISCGTGVFLVELSKAFQRSGWDTTIDGYDIDSGAIDFAKTNLAHENRIKLLEVRDTLLSSDDLFASSIDSYDIIVGNPPYVSSSVLDSKYRSLLLRNYASASTGVFDLSVVFIERIINLLKPDGVASVVVSNKFMTSKYGRMICKIIAERCHLLTIEDFDDIQLFKGQTTYTCILTFIKSKPGKKHTWISYNNDKSDNRFLTKIPESKRQTIEHDRLLTHPWRFYSNEEKTLYEKLHSDRTVPVTSVFGDIYQGIRTGANDIFIGGNEREFLHEEVNVPFVSGENIKGLSVTNVDQFVIYPYKVLDNKVIPLSESQFKLCYPETFRYLSTKREQLSSRSIQGKADWFEFSRSQSLSAVSKRKILVREMMPCAIFAFDNIGKYAFSSGYAFGCEHLDDHEGFVWAAVLSTPILEYALRKVGTQLHSGWFRVMKNHLLNLRLPLLHQNDIIKLKSFVSDNGLISDAQEINEVVRKVLNITHSEMSYIREYLKSIHQRSMPRSSVASDTERFQPVKLEQYNAKHIERNDLRALVTFTPNKKDPVHNWYKYTQGFSAGLVNELIDNLRNTSNPTIFDPFNGCGTTTTVCSYRGLKSVGYEISPLMCQVARVKSYKWDLDSLQSEIKNFSNRKKFNVENHSFIFSDYFTKAFSIKIISQIVSIKAYIDSLSDNRVKDLMYIALVAILEEVSSIRKHGSHYRFLNNKSSVGLQKLNIDVVDENTDVDLVFLKKIRQMYSDLCSTGGNPSAQPNIYCGSSFDTNIKSGTIDMVITSPPYLNRNNYIAQQKSELDILNIIKSKEEYRDLVKSTFRSHTDAMLEKFNESKFPEVNQIIKSMVLEKGNNTKIPHMIVGYFDDLESSLKEAYRVLKTGGSASYVVGNTRWGGVVVPIDHMLCKIAESIGFKVESIYVTRLKGNSPQQMKKFGRIAVRESIVNLRK